MRLNDSGSLRKHAASSHRQMSSFLRLLLRQSRRQSMFRMRTETSPRMAHTPLLSSRISVGGVVRGSTKMGSLLSSSVRGTVSTEARGIEHGSRSSSRQLHSRRRCEASRPQNIRAFLGASYPLDLPRKASRDLRNYLDLQDSHSSDGDKFVAVEGRRNTNREDDCKDHIENRMARIERRPVGARCVDDPMTWQEYGPNSDWRDTSRPLAKTDARVFSPLHETSECAGCLMLTLTCVWWELRLRAGFSKSIREESTNKRFTR